MRPYGPTTPVAMTSATECNVLRPRDLHGKSKLRAAAYRAKNVYPGPVGELVSRELLSFEEFGYVLAHDGLTNRLADHVLKAGG